MMSKDNICAVIVTHNRLNCLKICVDHMKAQTCPCSLLIVDNNSTDGTGEWCKELLDPDVYYFNTGANLGGAGGFNRGVRYACETGWEYLWLMDDDCWPEPDALEKLIEASAALNGEYGWLSSRCLWTDGSLCTMNVQRITPYKDLNSFEQPLYKIRMASFVSLFFPSCTVRRFGLPIADFFIWGDDWEYTRRISREKPCYYVGSSRVVHAMKNNAIVSIAEDTEDRLVRYQYSYRNDVYLYRREGIKGWLWILAKFTWHSIKTIRAGHMDRMKIIWRGFREGITFYPVIETVSGKEMASID